MLRGWITAALVTCACATPGSRADATTSDRDGARAPTLLAAAGTADITPATGAILVGFGTRASTSVRDPLEAAVLVLREGTRTIALVTVDLPGISEWHASLVRTLVASRAGAAYEDVLVLASHTHSAPMLGDDGWSRDAIDAIGRVAAEATTALEPATLGYAEDAVSFGVNRRLVVDGEAVARPNPEGPRDPRVRVLALRDSAGAPRAILSHAVCHPNVLLGVESTRISADYPGEARLMLRDLGAPWLFANGSAGDVRPNVVDGDGAFRLGDDADLVAIGGELARATRSAIGRAEASVQTPVASAHTTLVLPRTDGGERALELSAIRIGRVVLLAIPGEPLVEIGLAIEARLALELEGDVEVLVLGYANGYADYIVTEEAAQHGGYEVERAILLPGAARTIEDALVALAGSLF